MKTKILTTLTFCVLSNAYSEPQLFKDLTTHNLLKTNRNLFQEGNDLIRDTNSKVDETNSVLGRAGDNNVLQMHGKGVSDLLFRTHSMNSNVLSSFERVNNDPVDVRNWQNLAVTTKEVSDTLFPQSDKDGNVSLEEMDRVQDTRVVFMEEANKSSLALSATNQASVPRAQEEILKITKNAASAKNLRDDAGYTNQLLTVIANELTQIRQLMAKKMEQDGAYYTRLIGNNVQTAPLSKKNRKKEPTTAEILNKSKPKKVRHYY